MPVVHLPKEFHDKYQQVCGKCEHCRLNHPRPSRHIMSGLRAAAFGDLVLLDHTEVNLGGAPYQVLLEVGAPTRFLVAAAQLTQEVDETVRERMDPRSVVRVLSHTRACSTSSAAITDRGLYLLVQVLLRKWLNRLATI